MGRWLPAIAICLVFGAIRPAAAAPAKVLDGEIVAIVEQTVGPAAEHGFAPVWVDLQNNGARPATVELEFRGLIGQLRVRREVVLDPGERRVASLPVPSKARVGRLTVRTRTREATEQVSIAQEDGPRVMVLGSADDVITLAGLPRTTDVPDERPASEIATERLLPFARRQLPDLMAGYFGASAVVLLDPSAKELDPSQRSALEGWVLAGGLVIFGPAAVEARVPEALHLGDGSAPGQATRVGFGHVYSCAGADDCRELLRAQLWSPGGVADVRPEFEHDPEVPAEAADPNDPQAWMTGLRPRLTPFVDASGSNLLPDVGRPPVGAFLFIILLFVLAAGPGSVWVVRKYGRPLLLVSVPALSLVTCTGIAGWGIASDGLFTVHAASWSVTRLDTAAGRAVTLARTGYFAAVSPSKLTQPAGTIVLPGPAFERDYQLDWTDGLLVRGGVVPSRSYRELGTVSVQPSRARLVLTADGRSVENALGGRIVSLVLRSGDTLWGTRLLADGDRARLEPRTGGGQAEFQGELLAGLNEPLEEGEFVARLESWGGVPTGGLAVTPHPSTHWLRGKVAR